MIFNYANDKSDTRWIVGYSRVSTKEQTEGFSIQNQEMTIERIVTMMDASLYKIYKDEGKSAYKNVSRPEYEQLLEDVKANRIKAVIVWKSDRLLRNFVLTEELQQLFIRNNVALISATEYIDFTTADGRKEIRKRSIDNQFESERTSERVKASLEASARLGNYPKNEIPLGFKRIHNDYAAAPITPDPVTGPQIIKIFEIMYENRWGVTKMLIWLNSRHYLDKIWYETSLYKILLNPIYKGTYVNSLNKPEYEIKHHSPALVTEKLWDDVNHMIHNRSCEKKYNYVYKDLIFCDCCKARMIPVPTVKPNNKKTYFYYYCKNCKKRINEQKITMFNLHTMNQHLNKQITSCEDKKKKLMKLDHMLEQLDQHYLEDLVTEEYYSKTKYKYLQKKIKLEEIIKKIEKREYKRFDKLDFADKRKFLFDNIEKIYYNFEVNQYDIIFKNE